MDSHDRRPPTRRLTRRHRRRSFRCDRRPLGVGRGDLRRDDCTGRRWSRGGHGGGDGRRDRLTIGSGRDLGGQRRRRGRLRRGAAGRARRRGRGSGGASR